MFWNYSEYKIKDIVVINKTINNRIKTYCDRSKPKIGWDGTKNINHFRLFEKIYNNEFYISKKEVQDLLTPNLLELMKSEVRANFDELMTPERIIMICECLDYRFNKLSHML